MADATEKMMEDEASALAQMLTTEDRCAMVIVIIADNDGQSVLVTHSVAGQTRGSHLRQFIAGVERKLGWLQSKLVRGA